MPPISAANNLRLLAMRRVQLVEEFLARLQIGGVEPFGEAAINRCHEIACLRAASLSAQ